jgi:Domain of unknown function (DUF1330)
MEERRMKLFGSVAVLALIIIAISIRTSYVHAQDETAPAYVLVESLSITDKAAFQRYQALARDAMKKNGGQFLARGAKVESFQGQSDVLTLGLIRFPSMTDGPCLA